MFNRYTLFVFAMAVSAPVHAEVTWSKEVSRIVQGKCARCHREGDIAPFALKSYQDAATWAQDIKRVVEQRIMPPWKPVAEHGEFRDSYALTDEERNSILEWVAAGAPEGDPADLPEPLPDTGEWHLGEPDLILQMPKAFDVPRVKDLYRCFVIPTGLAEQKYLNAVQVAPGNRQIVHHVILFLDESGEAERLDGRDGRPGYDCFGGPGVALTLGSMMGGWVPGVRTTALPEGIGIRLRPQARIVMQVHYFPAGRPAPDQTRVGLYFAKGPVQKQLFYFPVLNDRFRIPAGAEDYVVRTDFRIPFLLDMSAITVIPHMHLLGRKIRVDLERRDGTTEPLIYIDDWDFNWQGFYNYVNPVRLPALSTLKLSCNFDNSERNPKNPNNPLKVVGWGEGTEDEMCIAFFGVTLDNQDLQRLLPFQRQSVE